MSVADFLTYPNITVIEKRVSASTNDDCRAYLAEHPFDAGSVPLLITAETQTSGRGRQGKQFSSPAGGLYMSILAPMETDFSETVRVTSAAAVAVCRAIQRVCGLSCMIKWVNDVYTADGKKLCGILTEAVNDYEKRTTKALIIGIGVNLEEVPPGIENASSIRYETGCVPDRERLCAAIAEETLLILNGIRAGRANYMDEYRRRSIVIGRNVRCIKDGVPFDAAAIAIDEGGGLVLAFPDGRTETVTSGEVTLRVISE